MRIDPLGESAAILRDLAFPAPDLAVFLNDQPGVVEAWTAFDTVGVIWGEKGPPNLSDFEPEIPRKPRSARTHEIPVLYDGEDLEEVAYRVRLGADEVVRFHAREYDSRAVGFCPGFAYLAPLPSEIDLPRRETPRPRVAPGSVAIAAGMTAVYPLERPGGWWLIGRTPLVLVDEADDYFPIGAGDRVRFVEISYEEFERRKGKRL